MASMLIIWSKNRYLYLACNILLLFQPVLLHIADGLELCFSAAKVIFQSLTTVTSYCLLDLCFIMFVFNAFRGDPAQHFRKVVSETRFIFDCTHSSVEPETKIVTIPFSSLLSCMALSLICYIDHIIFSFRINFNHLCNYSHSNSRSLY